MPKGWLKQDLQTQKYSCKCIKVEFFFIDKDNYVHPLSSLSLSSPWHLSWFYAGMVIVMIAFTSVEILRDSGD